MNFKKIARILVCLVLVCALLVGVSPIKAEAVLTEAVLASFTDDVILGIVVLVTMMASGFIVQSPDSQMLEDAGEALRKHVYEDMVFSASFPGDPSDSDDEKREKTWEELEKTAVKIKDQLTNAKWDGKDKFIAGLGLLGTYGASEFVEYCIEQGFFDSQSGSSGSGFVLDTSSGYSSFLSWVGGLDIYSMANSASLDQQLLLSYNSSYKNYSGYGIGYQSTSGLNYLSLIVGGKLNPYNSSSFPVGSFETLDSVSHYLIAAYLNYSDAFSIYYSDLNISNIYFLTGDSYISLSSSGYLRLSGLGCINKSTGEVTYGKSRSWSTGGTNPIVPSTYSGPVYPIATVGPIVDGIIAGGLTAADIPIPETVDLYSIFQGVEAGGLDAVVGNLNSSAAGLASGSIALDDFRQSITYTEESTEDPTEDPSPTEGADSEIGDGEQIPIEGTFANASVSDFLSNLGNLISAPFEWLWNQMKAFFSPWIQSIGEWFSEVRQDIQNIPGAFSEWFSNISNGITDFRQSVGEWFTNVIDNISAVPDRILEGIRSIFVPSDDYLTGKVDDLTKEFAFADSIVKTGQALSTGLAGITTEPPVIYIDLGATRGSYNIGGTVPFLDLRWYSEYKPTVDTIISAFLWICFVWRMLVKLPGIISGLPGDFVMESAHVMGVRDFLPTRSAENERQRIESRKSIWKGRK